MIDEILVNQALILDLERVEREAWADFYRASPGLATAECGVVVEEGDFEGDVFPPKLFTEDD